MSNWIKTVIVFSVIAVLMGFFNFSDKKEIPVIEKAKEGKAWDSDFYINQASPIASVEQYQEQDKFLPTVTEKERFSHPMNTEIQLRRARWAYEAANQTKLDPTKPQKHQSAEDLKKYEWRHLVTADITDVGKQADSVVKVLVNDTDMPIPALSTGKLPVFTDEQRDKYMPDLLAQGLDELDFRRAAWWFTNHQAYPIPSMPEDIEMRSQEEAAKSISDEEAREPKAYQRRYDALHRPAPLTVNERLTMAGNILYRLDLLAPVK